MSEQNLGIIGKSASKLAAEKEELKAALKTEMEEYVDAQLTELATLSHKLIEGKVTHFSLPTGVTKVKDYLLYNSDRLESVDLTGCKELGENALAKCYFIKNINAADAVIEKLGVGAFSRVGSDRDTQSLSTLVIDLRKSKFTFVGKHTFGGDDLDHKTIYTDIHLPRTLEQVANYAFQYLDHCNIFFDGMAPQLFGAYAFANTSDVKIYGSWRGLYGFKHNTNWSSLNVIGYGTEEDFVEGETLPQYTQDGYEITWYEDEDLQHPVTVADGHSHYYCEVIGTEKEASRILTRFEHCSVVISDGTNTYNEDHPIPYGTTVTITVTPEEGYESKFLLSINGVDINNGDTWTADEDTECSIISLYYDGVNAPVDPILNNNSADVIASVCKAGNALQYWNLGDELTIELSDGISAVFQLVDAKTGRYDKTLSSEKTNVVFMAKKILYSKRMNATNVNTGGFAASEMNTVSLPEIFNKMPQSWKRVIPEIQVKTAYSGTSDELATATCHLFLASGYELSGSAFNSRAVEADDIFGYYVDKTTNNDRIKYNASNQATNWWLRSPYSGSTNYFVFVNTNGTAYNGLANNGIGVVPCFAL